ncbi:MAG: murein biosynthesis integral membrane protein MurJ [Chlamydiae bacterium]|nr:murein biosynthesis integral membrane protein MurJ [Chlamydiota bacterium]MBI3277005.1 murein biosynthesis integral membrane protein MurJ [Chlamydiota bacterium]
MQNKREMARSASRVGLWTLASRVMGLARDSVVAKIFGVGFATDAFMVAFTIPNLLRRLLAEGALSIAFVPSFTEIFSKRSREEFHETFRVVFTAFSVLLVGVSLLGILMAPWVVKLFAPGFDLEKYQLTTQLTRIMFSFIFFMGSSAVVMGVLNTVKSFSIPAAAPVLLNLSIILCACFLSQFIHPPILSLAIGVLLGGFTQWGLQIWKVHQLGFNIGFKWDWHHPVLRKIFWLMSPTIFGVAVYHLNVMISRALASLLPQGSVTYLYYSDRFLEFPLGIFAVSVATVALPQLSQDAADGRFDHLKKNLLFALRLAAFDCIPSMIGLMILRVPLLSLVFQHGKFTFGNTLELAHVFLMASLGLCAIASLRIIVQAFYSMGDIKIPVKTACVGLVVNSGLGFFLMKKMGPSGLTLASSVSVWFQCFLLLFFLKKRVGAFSLSEFFREISSILLSAIVMGVFLWPLTLLNNRMLEMPFGIRVAYVLGSVALGLGVYVMMAYFLGLKELRVLVDRFFKKKSGSS